ncbi:MAG: hypothetical protein WAK17_06145 [Candidatus Nitrosopolaris sp.]
MGNRHWVYQIKTHGSAMRTGVSASRIPRKPSLLWVKEVGPSVSSPVFVDGTMNEVEFKNIQGCKYRQDCIRNICNRLTDNEEHGMKPCGFITRVHFLTSLINWL